MKRLKLTSIRENNDCDEITALEYEGGWLVLHAHGYDYGGSVEAIHMSYQEFTDFLQIVDGYDKVCFLEAVK